MDTNLIEAIEAYAQAKQDAAQVEALRKQSRIDTMRETIIVTLTKRIEYLVRVGNAARNHGIPLEGCSFGCHEGYDTHQFISNGWSHLTGFVVGEYSLGRDGRDRSSIVGVGKIGGGACAYNLIIRSFRDRPGPIAGLGSLEFEVEGNEEYVLNRFLAEFDTFETEFINYIQRTIERR